MEPRIVLNSPAGRSVELVVTNINSLLTDIAIARSYTKERASTVILDGRLKRAYDALERMAGGIAAMLEGYPEEEDK